MLVGIDLGTTNSIISYFKDGEAEIIPNSLGKNLTPSVVAVDEDNTVLVGETAREYGVLHPTRVAKVFKRSMGTDREFHLGEQTFRAEELSSIVLRTLKEDAQAHLGCEVTDAIISVPAYFNEFQRKATKQAGELAGLNVQRIINEPTAAAIAYGVGQDDKDERCLVFDLGGGTFDVSILSFFKNIMEVHAVAGDNFLGGEDFTQVLANMFLEKSAIAPESLDVKNKNRVMKAAEAAKCADGNSKELHVTCQIDGETIEATIPMKEYEDACQPLLERMRKPLERSIRDANLKLSEIDKIVLVGGATRLGIVKRFVIKLFGMFPGNIDPDLAIAIGAAMQCGMKERDKAIQEVILTDVCPFTLGTEVNMSNGYFDESNHYLPIIERNTVIPVSRTQTVYTASDNQTRVRVKILQGESRIASNNINLGEINVPVPAKPRGEESVDITYTYDVNSLLEVIVKVNSTGVSRREIIQGGEQKLTEAEAEERIAKLAHLKKHPREEEKNKLLILRGERVYEESISNDRVLIDTAIMAFQQALERQNDREIETAREALEKLLDRIEMN